MRNIEKMKFRKRVWQAEINKFKNEKTKQTARDYSTSQRFRNCESPFMSKFIKKCVIQFCFYHALPRREDVDWDD